LESIRLVFPMPLFSKARPRVTQYGVFMPKDYLDKRKQMITLIQEQYTGEPIETPIRLDVELFGEGRGDADNIIGSLMDAGNKLLWADDRLGIISEISVVWTKTKKADSKWIVEITPLN